ncbi:unnamed protein product [Closterium sp. Yama58-4]|nr:unnamed protein product [Closterium sp. Yama58-4]
MGYNTLGPEKRKQPFRYTSWSKQVSVVELRDQSFLLHSQALSSIIAVVLASLPGTFQHNRSPETRKQLRRYKSWSGQFSVVELRDQSFSLHSQALSSIIPALRRENSRTGTGHGAGNFPSWSSVTNRSRFTPGHFLAQSQTRKRLHRYRLWSRHFSVVELHDQSSSLHSQALPSIIAGPPETRKQPHRYRSWSRQFSVVELRDQSFLLHSQALSSIIAALRRENSCLGRGHGAGNFPSCNSLTNRSRFTPGHFPAKSSWSRQFSVVELRDQSFSLHSRALSNIIAGTFQHNCSPKTRKQLRRYKSWSKQLSVVELRDQSFLLHSWALSCIIASPPEMRKQSHRYRSWSRQFSVVELRDQSFSLHSRALSSIIAGLQFSVVELRDQSFSLHSRALSSIIANPPETRKQPHWYRSWSRQFSVVELRDQSFSLHSWALSSIVAGPQFSAVELRDQSFSLHSRALSSIIAAPRRENSHADTGHGACNFSSWSSVTNRSRFTPGHFSAQLQLSGLINALIGGQSSCGGPV